MADSTPGITDIPDTESSMSSGVITMEGSDSESTVSEGSDSEEEEEC